MPNQNGFRLFAVVAGVLLLTLLFVSYRARTFHYCAGIGDRPAARVADSAAPCRADEEPLEFRRLGWPGSLKLAAQATAKAFGAN
jgi:hypothetical protein